ncbi:hypothetical protein CBR_g68715 [Chara braunii]|uniref:Uncharacterized protein n=1 Tax=Chara braunii TaxID=69332 RepID=A0A388K9N3_CHABU|nr:hypothetical protein CBR_g68715 [Chara braunii]|eukprot:GBG66731.1 hypothetical protein CBR_g68715 [Chara braunii]
MEREPSRLRKLCSSFIREDDGVMLLGRAHAGLIWELARAGHHVFACDDTTKELTYLSEFLDFYVKDPRNRCRFEKPQVKHRKDRNIYYKLGRKREKVWAYLFGDAPQSAVDNDYVIRKSKLEIAMNEYHGSHMGAFHMFVARCAHLYLNMKKRAPVGRDYADLARKAGNINNIDCDENMSDSDLDVPSRAARGAAEGARGEEPQGSTNGPGGKASSSQWQMAVKRRDRGWVAKEKKDAAIWHSVTETQIYRRVLKENVGASEEAIAAKAKVLFEHLRANKKLEFSTKFYNLASSVSYGSINWKIELASAVKGIDSINSLKTQDVIASNTIIEIARGDPSCEKDTRANAGHVQDEQQRACAQQSTPRSAMGDSTMIRKDGDDMELGALIEQPTGGVNDGTTNVGSFGSLVAAMTARQGISEMMETDAGQDDGSQAVKVSQEEVAATTEQATKGEGSREHMSIIDMTSESTGEDMIQEKEQKDDNNAPRVEGDHEQDVQQLRRPTRPVIKKVVVDA